MATNKDGKAGGDADKECRNGRRRRDANDIISPGGYNTDKHVRTGEER